MGDPLSIASGIAGLVAIADTVFTRAFRYARGVYNADKDIAELATGIRSLSGLLHGLSLVLSELEKGTSESNFRLYHVNSLRETLIKIQTKLDVQDPQTSDGKSKQLLKRLKWPFSQSETKQLVADVEKHKQTINIALSVDGLAATLRALSRQGEVVDEIRDLKEKLKSKWALETQIAMNKERREVLTFFGKIDPSSNHEKSLSLRHPLTGLWVSEGTVFKTWLHTQNSRLWLSGIPGAGKTVIAASLIEETLQESSPMRAVAYFYCDYKDAEKQDPINMLGSLAAQLARQSEKAFDLLQELFQLCHPEDRPSSQPRLNSLLKTLGKMTTCFEDVSIIIDGLDECRDNVTLVAETIISLSLGDQSNTRLMILSRDISEIRNLVAQQFANLDIAARSDDLKLFVPTEIERRIKLHGRSQLTIRNPELKQHITTTLVDRADGMFRWVTCQLDYLCTLRTDNEKRKALTSLPPTLKETYERILDDVNRSDKIIQRLVQAALQWIVNAPLYLTTKGLCEALSMEEGNKNIDRDSVYCEEDILECCGSLIRRGNDTLLEVAHFTVQEFLLDIQPGSRFSMYSQQEDIVRPQLARTCLTYLNLEDFQHCLIEDWKEWELQQLQHPFRASAVYEWLVNAQYCWDDPKLRPLVQLIYNPSRTTSFLSWARDCLYFHAFEDDEGEPYPTRPDEFSLITKLIWQGGATPLHLAAAQGLIGVCQWLLDYGCNFDQNSSLGTPLHCAMLGIYPLSRLAFDDACLSTVDGDNLREQRMDVLKMLIGKGPDLSAPLVDRSNRLVSYSKLALHAGLGKGRDHSLVWLLDAGAELGRRDLRSLEEFDEEIEGYEDFIDALVEKLQQRPHDDEAKTELLTVALQYKNSSALRIVMSKKHHLNSFSAQKWTDLFIRAIQYDKTEVLESFLESDHFSPTCLYGEESRTALHIAAAHEASQAIRLLLCRGVPVDNSTGPPAALTPLHCAVARLTRDPACITSLLDHGANPAALDADGRTAWHIGAEHNNTIALKIFLARDGHQAQPLFIQEKKGCVPILCAAKSKSVSAVELLLKTAPVVPPKCKKGLSLVHYVAGMDSIKLLRLMKEIGMKLDELAEDGRNALHFVEQGDDGNDIIRLLCDSGLDITATESNGPFPLHMIIFNEVTTDQDVIKLLVNEKSISQANNNGYTALHYAVYHPSAYQTRYELVKILVQLGADCNARTGNGETVIDLLFEDFPPHNDTEKKRGRDEMDERDSNTANIIMYMLPRITDLSILDTNPLYGSPKPFFGSVICWALYRNKHELVRALIAENVNIDAYSTASHSARWSAIHWACFSGAPVFLFEELLGKTVRSFEPDSMGNSIVHLLCWRLAKGTPDHLKSLKKFGVDLNMQNGKSGRTPLMIATESGKVELVDFLLRSGVDFKIKDNFDWQACNWIRQDSILESLIEYEFDWIQPVDITFNSKIHNGCNVLHQTVLLDSTYRLKRLLESNLGLDINCLNKDGLSPLHLAALYSSATMVEALLEHGAMIDVESYSGIRPITSAIMAKRESTVELLLQHGCSLNVDRRGMTPESDALISKDLHIIRMIRKHISEKAELTIEQCSSSQIIDVKNGKDVDKKPEESNSRQGNLGGKHASRALVSAIKGNDLELCKMLIKAGLSVNEPLNDCGGCTPLLYSLLYERLDIARYLLEEGASSVGQVCSCRISDVKSERLQSGFTAIHLACYEESYSEILELLLPSDLEAGGPGFHGPVTPLHVAVLSNNLKAVQILVQHAHTNLMALSKKSSSTCVPIYDRTIRTQDLEAGQGLSYAYTSEKSPSSYEVSGSALHIAVRFNCKMTILDLLLKSGTNPNIPGENEKTPLHLAVEGEDASYLELLLQHGANSSTRDMYGYTPAVIAADTGYVEGLVVLERWGASLNDVDDEGDTLLHFAARESQEVFLHLISRGQDPYRTNYKGATAIEVVVERYNCPGVYISLLGNFGFDFERCPGLLSRMVIPNMSYGLLRILLRRLPKRMITAGINTRTNPRDRGSLLCQAARSGRLDILPLLLQAGANMELDLDGQGTPLLASCLWGRFEVVKYLVSSRSFDLGKKGWTVVKCYGSRQAVSRYCSMAVGWTTHRSAKTDTGTTRRPTTRSQTMAWNMSGRGVNHWLLYTYTWSIFLGTRERVSTNQKGFPGKGWNGCEVGRFRI